MFVKLGWDEILRNNRNYVFIWEDKIKIGIKELINIY